MPCRCSSKTDASEALRETCPHAFPNSVVSLLVLLRCLFGGLLLPTLLPYGYGPLLPFGNSLVQLLIEFALLFSCQLPPSSPSRSAEGFPALSALLPVSVQLSKPWACLGPQR